MTKTDNTEALGILRGISELAQCWINLRPNDRERMTLELNEQVNLLRAALTSQVPEGWQLVPKELNTAMALELVREWDSTGKRTVTDNWAAVLAAAPVYGKEKGDTMEMLVSNDWLREKIIQDPDIECDAGAHVYGTSSVVPMISHKEVCEAISAPVGRIKLRNGRCEATDKLDDFIGKLRAAVPNTADAKSIKEIHHYDMNMVGRNV